MILLWSQFIICAIIIFYFGEKLAEHGEKIALRLSLSAGIVGFIFLAAVTSLPEVFTAIASVTFIDAPDFAVGDTFGSMAFNLLIIILLDALQSKRTNLPILYNAEKINTFSILAVNIMLLVCAVSIFLRKQYGLRFGFLNIGYESCLLIILYSVYLKIIFAAKKNPLKDDFIIEEDKTAEKDYLWPKFALTAFFIIGSGFWLAKVGEKIVLTTGWSKTFFGTVFLAVATSLPEVFVSTAVLKNGFKTKKVSDGINMAVGNVVGSNLFDVLIIPICDIFYRKGEILSDVSSGQNLTVFIVLFFGTLIMRGIMVRSKKMVWRLGCEPAIMLLSLILIGLFFFFYSLG